MAECIPLNMGFIGKGGGRMGWRGGAHGVLLNVMMLMIHVHDMKK